MMKYIHTFDVEDFTVIEDPPYMATMKVPGLTIDSLDRDGESRYVKLF